MIDLVPATIRFAALVGVRAIGLLVLLHGGVALAAEPTVSCDSLAKLTLPQATITMAETVAAGTFDIASEQPNFFYAYNLAGRAEQGGNPDFCRLAATLKPSSDSDIKIEVWLPSKDWNGKFIGVGNFGWAGVVNHAGMLAGLQAGYAVASTDTGHQDAGSKTGPGGGSFALGHPEKLIDYAYRADHEMTVDAKAVVTAFYGAGPAYSYWIGCSLGGLEGLVEAKRYPADYDGIIAGAPPNPITDFNAMQIWASWLITKNPASQIPREKLTMVHDAVVAQCATPVGKNDNLVDEPDKCAFDPKSLLCQGANAADCLTAPQAALLQQEYDGPTNPRTGVLIFPGPARGAELTMFAEAQPMSVATDIFKYVAFQDANWDPMTMDWDKMLTAAKDKIGPLMHVEPADLKPFLDGGGKLIFYIGWNDSHNPQQLIGFYNAVIEAAPAATRSMRLFAIPGMNHCGGGEGCDTFNRLGAIDEWVTHGQTPERILASKVVDGAIIRSRPLCAYPAVLKYMGQGDINDATNFTCRAN